MRGHPVFDLGDQSAPQIRIVQASLEHVPRLRASEGQSSGVHASAARTRQNLAHLDALLLERLADAHGLSAPLLVEIALRAAVVEPRVGRIEAAGRVAVTEDDDAARRAQGIPHGVRGLRRRHGERIGDDDEQPGPPAHEGYLPGLSLRSSYGAEYEKPLM